MSQDVVADALNKIMNAKKAGKKELEISKTSKLLLKVLSIAKESEFLDYEINEKIVHIKIEKLNELKAIKPRYSVSTKKIDKYVKRFLPAKNFGFLIVSTSKGLMKHYDAQEKNLGGCLIAYMF